MQKTKSNILNDLDSVDRDYTPRRWRTYRRYTELLSRLIFCERKFRRKTISIISIYANSNHVYKEYYTIDWQHRSNIRSLRDMIEEYFKSSEIKRPLCFLIGGDPGSGKSHFVKSMANSLVNAKFVEDNLASFESFNSIATSVENVRNAKAHDLNPILFLDEADAYNKKYFNNLLPLMWDGKVFFGTSYFIPGKDSYFLCC